MSMFSSGKIAARVTSTLYYTGNMGLGSLSTSNWQMRTDAQRPYKIGFASDGVIDLGLAIHHTFKAGGVKVALTANLQSMIDLTPAGGSEKGSQSVWRSTIPGDARFTLVSERGSSESGTVEQKIYEIPELRQPIHSFYLYLTPDEAPDEGDLYVRVIRRY